MWQNKDQPHDTRPFTEASNGVLLYSSMDNSIIVMASGIAIVTSEQKWHPTSQPPDNLTTH